MKKTKAKTRKILIIFTALIILMGAYAFLYASSTITNPTLISFEDSNLFNAIQICFNAHKDPLSGLNDPIKYNIISNETNTLEVSLDDLPKIVELNLSGSDSTKITSIAGLENFPNVTELNLSGNNIQSLEPIVDVYALTNLNLSGNVLTEEMKTEISSFETLTELNLSNTNIDKVDFLANLINLENLTLSKNLMPTLTPISGLSNITKLDVSQCTSYREFGELAFLHNLKELDVSGTGIYYLTGIESLMKLEKLYAANINRFTEVSAIESIYATYEKEIEVEGKLEEVDVPYLQNLKVLNLSNMGITDNKPSINLKNFKVLTTLEELHLKSNEISKLTDVAQLENLDYLDLADNEIESEDLSELVQYEQVEDEYTGKKYTRLKTENTLKATKIDLSKNEIIELDIFSIYPAYIKWLNLSENHIYKITPLAKHKSSLEMINLQKQNITFGIYEKKVETDHYIILPEILTWSKVEGSLIYSENSKLTYNGVTLNPAYPEPEEYNVIIDSTKTEDDSLSVTLIGGTASGTVLNFQIGSKSDAHVDCLIETLVFVDENLDAAIYNDLKSSYEMETIKYIERVPLIININQAIIKDVEQFNLAHTSTTNETKIRDLTGLENFSNLEVLLLQNNNLVNINSLIGCTKLQTLDLSNNPNIGDNNSSIENLSKLMDLDLSNTGMTNINAINNLIYNNYTSKKKTPILAILKISGNKLNSIEGLEKITSLEALHIQNTSLNDEDIAQLSTLTNLVTLNFSENEIENIDVVSNFTRLQYLYLNKNKIKSLEPIDGMTFSELKFSDNKVKDISPLYAHQSIDNLEMNNNQIEDVTILSNIMITEDQILSATGQKITRILEKTATGDVSIALPQIFRAARESGNKLYTNYELILTDCDLDSTGENVIINVEELGDKIAQVSIYGGKANGTILSIAAPLKGTITYTPSNEELTNQDVTAKITFNRSDVTITNNDGNNTYTFKENGEFTFEFVDKYGFEGTETAEVANIDKVAPQTTEIIRQIVDKQIVVTIKVNEPIKQPEGWAFAEDGLSITKTYTEDANETVNLEDIAGNITSINMEIKMDRTAPTITGAEDGQKYKSSVTPVVEDENLDTVTLTKDGQEVENYQLGTPINEPGEYVITATDKFENTTTVSFSIEKDTIAPTITGIEDGMTYNDTVTPVIEDENLATVVLKKDGTVVENYQSGTAITESGQYVLEAVDTFGNTTTVSFEIEVSDVITSKDTTKVTVDEDKTIVTDISPNTTVGDLDALLEADMDYTMVDKDGNELSETEIVGTGCKIKMANDNKIYTIILPGDCNGDGAVSVSGDMIKLNVHRLSGRGLTGEYLMAADLNEDGKIMINDMILMNVIRLKNIQSR